MTKFTFTLIAVIALSTTVAFGGEWIIFSEELPPGADLALRADSQFVVSNSNPYQGANHLKRDFATWGEWAWITGIMSLNLDLSGIDFDTAYLEFYIDGGTDAISYLELRLGGPDWDPDFGTTSVTVDDQPGYEQVRVMLKDFTSNGVSAANLDEFTGGTGVIDRISWGFGATGDLFVDEVRIVDAAGGANALASNPDPADGAYHEDTWVTLSWKPGQLAVSHDVYLGGTFEEVEQATPESDVFRGNQVTTYYVAGFPGFAYPEGLVPGTTYYWRIDEVNDADPNSPWKGNVWSFSIPPKTAYNPDPADSAEIVSTTVTLIWTPGFGAKLHTVYFGDDYNQVNDATLGVPVGTASYNPGPLAEEKVYYWRIDAFDGIDTFKGDVWTFTTPGAVGSPQPANGATDVAMDATLSWTAANNPASHQVYLGLDKDTVRSADTSSPEYRGPKALGDESYDPGMLELGSSYYWRVDEVYNGNTVKGPVWTFTVGDFLLVEDFESYTDDDAAGQAIWQHWIDGFGIADNGAQVGYLMPPYAERTIVHGGSQSMPLLYANEAGVTNSEGVLTLTTPRDWTLAGVAELSLWFRGSAANAAEPLYVAISNSAGAPAVIVNDDSQAALARGWTQWTVPLQALADRGINLANVDKIAIGLGTKSGVAGPGGSGTVYIDDIRLYRP
jgi:hypothetical protein